MEQKTKKTSLRNKLMVWFLILALTPLIGVSLFSYIQYTKSLLTKASIELKHSSESNKMFFDNWFDFRLKDINNQSGNLSNARSIETLSDSYKRSNLALQAFINSPLWLSQTQDVQSHLLTMKKNYDYIYDIILIDTSANILFTLLHEHNLGTNLLSDTFKDTKLSSTALETLNSSKTLFSGVERHSPSNDLLSVFFTAPLTNNRGETVGVIAIQVKLDTINSLFSATQKQNLSNEAMNKGITHYLVDHNHVLQTPINEEWQDVLHKKIDLPFNKSAYLKNSNNNGSNLINEYVDKNNNRILSNLKKITASNIEWTLVTEIPLKTVLKNADWLAKAIIISIILFILFIIMIVLSITKKITAPLVTLTDASLKAASSNENLRIEQTTNDEIGQLTSSFNFMVEKRNSDLANIKRSSHEMALVLKNTGVGFWDLDISNNTIECNPRWYEITGYSKEDLTPFTGDKYLALIHPVDVKDAKYLLLEHIKNQETIYNIEFRINHKNGNWIWVNDKGSVVERDEQNRALRVIGTTSDITKEKRLKIQQEKSYQTTQVKLEISKVLNQDVSLEVRLNQAIEKCLDLSELNISHQGGIFLISKDVDTLSMHDLQGKFSQPFIHDEQSEKLGHCLCGMPAQLTEIIISDNCALDRQNENSYEDTFPHGHYIIPLVHSTGKTKTTVGILFFYTNTDPIKIESVTALLKEVGGLFTATIVQEQAKILLEEASRLAGESNNLKGEFLASMSHEIRTPMNGVLGMLDLLLSSGLNKDQAQKAKLAQSSAESLLVLINDILDFSKIEAGKMDLDEYDFNLLTMLGEFSKAIAYNAQEKGLELILDTTKIDNPMIRGDQGRIRQILTNLVGNAIKFTHQGEITLEVDIIQKQDRKVQLTCSIQDTGIGIPKEKLNTLFDSFSQVDASTTRVYGGTGLGLTISKNLCELMNGQVTVTSQINEGSNFTFSIELQKSQKRIPYAPPTIISGLNILLVNENDKTNETLKIALTKLGVKACAVTNVEDAISICKKMTSTENDSLSFDAIYIDSQIPKVNGKCLASLLRDEPETNKIPKLMITLVSSHFDEIYYQELDICYNFSKPCTHQDLVSSLIFIRKLENRSGKTIKINKPVEKTDINIATQEVIEINQNDKNNENNEIKSHWPEDYRILLVEDNRVNQVVAQGVLKRFNLKADVANNGIEALEALKESVKSKPFTLILMDCQMPQMDGYEATRCIRNSKAGKRFKLIPILAMTANAMDGDKEQCIEAGMDDYITKPIAPILLEKKLNQWLSNSNETGKDKKVISNEFGNQPLPENFAKEELSPSSQRSKEKSLLGIDEGISSMIWNEDECLNRVSQNKELLKRILQVFIDESPETIKKIDIAIGSIEEISQRDSKTEIDIALDQENTKALCKNILKLAHLMKGLTGNLSADQFYQLATQLEIDSKNEDFDSIIASKNSFTLAHAHLMVKIKSYINN